MPRVRRTQSECRPRKLNETREEQIRTPWRPEREASSSVTHFLTAVNFDKTMLNENQVTTVAAHNLAGGLCFPSRAQAESGKADTAQCLTAVINTKLRLHAPELFLPPERRMTVGGGDTAQCLTARASWFPELSSECQQTVSRLLPSRFFQRR